MNSLVMYDAIDTSQYPPAGPGTCFAGYVDGHLVNQPDYGWLVQNRPGSPLLSIALSPADDADCLDIEGGAATPASAAAWYERQKARGITRPCFYASTSVMQANVVPVIEAAGIARAGVRLWTAHYTGTAHICGPGSCGQLGIDADGTQWTSAAMGRDLDQSELRADFFGGWVFSAVRQLTLLGAGPHSVKASWESPGIQAPEAVGWYQVTVRRLGQDVASPVCIAKGPSLQVYQWNNLTPATQYEFRVRAMTAAKGHASPWAVLDFKTAKA